MAEVEYKGIKLSGGKMLFVLPLLGTLGGGLWAGFEFYKDYLNMKEQIQGYVSPDLSHIDNHMTMVEGQLAVISEEFKGLKQADTLMDQLISEQVNGMKQNVSDMQTAIIDMKMEIKSDMADINDTLDASTDKVDQRMDAQDGRNRNNIEDVRNIISSFENRMDRKMESLDKKIDELENELDMKIKRALDNPLANGG